MRVAFNAINVKSYGITNYTLKLIENLKKVDDSLDITLFTNSEAAEHFINVNEYCNMVILNLKNVAKKTFYTNFILPFRIKNFDIVHSIGNLGMLYSPIPQIITIHDAYEVKSPERFSVLKRTYMKIVIAIAGMNAKKIIAVSKNTAKDVEEYYHFLKNKVCTIYSGCNFPVIKYDNIVIEKKKYFLFVGTIEPGKNLKTLLQAMKVVGPTDGYCLKVVGAKGWKQANLVDSESLPYVNFMGKISDEKLITLYKNATALVFPSLYEGFGFPVIEALANGCPVIAADNSAISEAGGKCATYFSALDKDVLVEKMRKVISLTNDIEKIKKRIISGLEQAKKFDWKKTASKVKELYYDHAI